MSFDIIIVFSEALFCGSDCLFSVCRFSVFYYLMKRFDSCALSSGEKWN